MLRRVICADCGGMFSQKRKDQYRCPDCREERRERQRVAQVQRDSANQRALEAFREPEEPKVMVALDDVRKWLWEAVEPFAGREPVQPSLIITAILGKFGVAERKEGAA